MITCSPKSRKTWRRLCLVGAAAIVIAGAFGSISAAAVKKVPYPEIKVTVSTPYKPDAAFERMRTAFADSVAKKDLTALTALVAPSFLWTVGGRPADEMDLGREAVHNFKVVFGFRAPGKDVDGGVDGGPYWDALAAFAADATYYAATDAGNLICGPIAADVDDDVFDQARKKVENRDDGADWFFTLAPTDVFKAPGDTGPPIAKVGTIAMPMLGTYPAAQEGQPAVQLTHIEVLQPSGKSGWIPAGAVRPLFTDHLCYARTPSGEWKIAAIDQPSE